jgi:hypothetical protein
LRAKRYGTGAYLFNESKEAFSSLLAQDLPYQVTQDVHIVTQAIGRSCVGWRGQIARRGHSRSWS